MRLLMLVALMACGAQVEDQRESELRSSANMDAHPPQAGSDSALAVADSDTVSVIRFDGVRKLVWTSIDGGRKVERYQSGDLFGGLPHAQLRDVDRDGLLDLFVTWQYEEQASGLLLRARVGMAAEILYRAAPDICGPPELDGPDEEGWPLIVEYEPGAASLTDCREGGPLATCVDNYFVEWPRVLTLRLDGARAAMNTSGSLRNFYAGAAGRYGEALTRLREAVAADPSAVCGEIIPSVEELRSRAVQLAQGQ